MQFAGATSTAAGFPNTVLVDTAKVHALTWGNRHYYFLPEVDLLWPHAPNSVLYRTILLPEDSTGWNNQPCGVIGDCEIILTFPLYFLQYNDARNIMQASIARLRTCVVGIEPHSEGQVFPTTLKLDQNYPNPFNPTTTILFDLPAYGQVEIAVFNTLGQKVTTLVNEVRAPGSYRVTWDGKNSSGLNVSSGVYIYRIQAGTSSRVQKMVLMR
jgi:hypothetical protein